MVLTSTLNIVFWGIDHVHKQLTLMDIKSGISGLERRIKVAEGHIEAGRILAFYQVLFLFLRQYILYTLISHVLFGFSISRFLL